MPQIAGSRRSLKLVFAALLTLAALLTSRPSEAGKCLGYDQSCVHDCEGACGFFNPPCGSACITCINTCAELNCCLH